MKLDAANNRLLVGTKDQLLRNALLASKISWVSGKAPKEPVQVTTKIRYKSPEVTATLSLRDGEAEVNFHQPQWAIAPGQAIVFYQDDVVLGGGIIENTENGTDTVFN